MSDARGGLAAVADADGARGRHGAAAKLRGAWRHLHIPALGAQAVGGGHECGAALVVHAKGVVG